MPLWFIDTPSDTEMVVNGTGTALPAATPRRAASACGPSDIEQGVFSPCVLTMPTIGLARSSSSTGSKGMVVCDRSYNRFCTSN